MSSSLSTVAARRIQSELRDWHHNPAEGCALESVDDTFTTWVVRMLGPDATPGLPSLYQGQMFRLRIRFPDRYPLESPEVIFLPPAPVHPHIYSNGHCCVDILYDSGNGAWSPALTINKVCLALRSMLASNTDYSRPASDEDYCRRVGNRSPKQTAWLFEDDKV